MREVKNVFLALLGGRVECLPPGARLRNARRHSRLAALSNWGFLHLRLSVGTSVSLVVTPGKHAKYRMGFASCCHRTQVGCTVGVPSQGVVLDS